MTDSEAPDTNLTSPRMKGTVIQLPRNKGYGFLRGHGDGLTRFFEAKAVRPPIDFDYLSEGESVTFTPAEDPQGRGNGLRAVNVEKL